MIQVVSRRGGKCCEIYYILFGKNITDGTQANFGENILRAGGFIRSSRRGTRERSPRSEGLHASRDHDARRQNLHIAFFFYEFVDSFYGIPTSFEIDTSSSIMPNIYMDHISSYINFAWPLFRSKNEPRFPFVWI